MASGRKKKTSAGAARNKTGKKSPRIGREIAILVSLAVCLFLMFANFGLCGFIGDACSDFLFGMFGFIAYIVPIFLFIGVAFFVSNKGNYIAYVKAAACFVFCLMICTIFQIVTGDYEKGTSLGDYFRMSKLHRDGGGILGGMFVNMLRPSVGKVGTWIVVLAVCVICFVIITEKSLIGGIKNGGRKIRDSVRDNSKRRGGDDEEDGGEPASGAARKTRGDTGRGKTDPDADENAALGERKIKTRRKDKTYTGVSRNTEITKEKEKDASDMKEPLPFDEDDARDAAASGTSDVSGVSAGLHKNALYESSDKAGYGTCEIPGIKMADKRSASGTKGREGAAKEMRTSQEESGQLVITAARPTGKDEAKYHYPPMSLLRKGSKGGGDSSEHLRRTAMKLQQTLMNFNVNVTVTDVSRGPAVTRYELLPEQGVKVSRIVALANDIKLNLAVPDIRIEAPIPGKAAVGIEVPNDENSAVMLRDILESPEFTRQSSKIAFAVGRDITGKPVVADIATMPHLLIAGATGSGKSVCINTIIVSILYKATPDEVRFIMIDPKVVELKVYNGIPHLLIPVVTDPKKATGALNWAVAEMTDRYQKFAEMNVRDIKGYNEAVESLSGADDEEKPKKLPQIVIIVDELADLMMVAPKDVEDVICRLAQLARAAGIHLVIATQRPSVNVITGLIKANMPSRIAFSVVSGVDSRTIIDMNGAEKLLGKGDMLFYPTGYPKPVRVQGSYVSDKEVESVVDFLKEHTDGEAYDDEVERHITSAGAADTPDTNDERNDVDPYFADAGKFIIEKDKASIGMLQRIFKIGFNRAARIMDQLCDAGVVGEEEGTKPRNILMNMEQFENYLARDQT